MVQLVVNARLREGEEFSPGEDDYHYLVNVRRIRVGDRLTMLDPDNKRWDAEVLSVTPTLIVSILHESVAAGDTLSITVYQAIPKGRKFDDAVRQLVQAGVSRIVPLVTERTVARPEDGGAKSERWSRVAREAMQQSGSSEVVEVGSVTALGDIERDPDELSLFLHTSPLATGTLHGYLGETVGSLRLAVGPEGGFSPSELALLERKGFLPVWLGTHVLRSENAGFFAVAAARMILLERDQWRSPE